MKVTICDSIVIQREVEIPDTCPRCRNKQGPGARVGVWRQLPQHVAAELNTVQDEDSTGYGVTVKAMVSNEDCRPNSDYWPVVVHCLVCNYRLTSGIRRTYFLEAMDEPLAAKLQNILYDYNVQDETIQKHVFGKARQKSDGS